MTRLNISSEMYMLMPVRTMVLSVFFTRNIFERTCTPPCLGFTLHSETPSYEEVWDLLVQFHLLHLKLNN